VRKDLFKTLFSRMLTTYMAVILSLLLLMGITVSGMFKNQYISEAENALKREAAKINTILDERYAYEEKRQAAKEELLMLARSNDALIQVFDRYGGIAWFYDTLSAKNKWASLAEAGDVFTDPETGHILHSQPGVNIWPDECMIKTGERLRQWEAPDKHAKKLDTEGDFCWNLFSNLSGMHTLSLIKPIVRSGGQVDGVMMIHFDMSTVEASISKVYLDVLLISCMAVVAAILAVYYLTTKITKPITDISAVVRRYSKGEFDLRLEDEGEDEVAQLARSFNSMADELSDLEQTRRSFVANVSHELRSPLTSMRGFLEAIQDGTIPQEEQGKYLGIVIDETRRMSDMVNDLLNLARMESGQQVIHIQQFDVNELILRNLITFEPRINARKLDVQANLSEEHCYVEADSGQIAQVVRNLIDNAIKFSPEGGVLEITVKSRNRSVAVVSVKDQGVGIPKEDIPHIFDRFYKVEKAHTPSQQSGTGLGLAIVKRIIDQHDQDITVESGTWGTCFTFTLKKTMEPAPRNRRTNEGNAKTDGSRHPSGGERI